MHLVATGEGIPHVRFQPVRPPVGERRNPKQVFRLDLGDTSLVPITTGGTPCSILASLISSSIRIFSDWFLSLGGSVVLSPMGSRSCLRSARILR